MLTRRAFLALVPAAAAAQVLPEPSGLLRWGAIGSNTIRFVPLGMRLVQLPKPKRPGDILTIENDGRSSLTVQGEETGALFHSLRGVRSTVEFMTTDGGENWKLLSAFREPAEEAHT